MANTLIDQKRYREAEPHALAGYQILAKNGPVSADLENARRALVAIYTAVDQPEKLKMYVRR
jgi:hypothetical protein